MGVTQTNNAKDGLFFYKAKCLSVTAVLEQDIVHTLGKGGSAYFFGGVIGFNGGMHFLAECVEDLYLGMLCKA